MGLVCRVFSDCVCVSSILLSTVNGHFRWRGCCVNLVVFGAFLFRSTTLYSSDLFTLIKYLFYYPTVLSVSSSFLSTTQILRLCCPLSSFSMDSCVRRRRRKQLTQSPKREISFSPLRPRLSRRDSLWTYEWLEWASTYIAILSYVYVYVYVVRIYFFTTFLASYFRAWQWLLGRVSLPTVLRLLSFLPLLSNFVVYSILLDPLLISFCRRRFTCRRTGASHREKY